MVRDMPDARRSLTDDDRRDWLRLIRSENVGPTSFFQLLHHFGNAAGALEALPELAGRGGRKALRIADRDAAERELEALRKAGIVAVALPEPGYPAPLRAIADPPPLLFLRGDARLLARDAVAVVGARNASASGVRLARTLAHELGEAGYVVVSGLARGIDTAAHRGAIESGTVAVIAGGVDMVYPPENQELYDNIVASGLAISETALGTVATARHFPRRNRLISGLSLGVLVVEAAPRSGSLITARMAAEQGREVFAVPGSPLDPRARGTNGLIRQGAQLTESVEDIVDGLSRMRRRRIEEPSEPPFSAPSSAPSDPSALTGAREAVLGLLGATPVDVDELIRQAELTPPVVITILLELDLAGRLDRHPGNRVSLR
jgi:DNA processing protein